MGIAKKTIDIYSTLSKAALEGVMPPDEPQGVNTFGNTTDGGTTQQDPNKKKPLTDNLRRLYPDTSLDELKGKYPDYDWDSLRTPTPGLGELLGNAWTGIKNVFTMGGRALPDSDPGSPNYQRWLQSQRNYNSNWRNQEGTPIGSDARLKPSGGGPVVSTQPNTSTGVQTAPRQAQTVTPQLTRQTVPLSNTSSQRQTSIQGPVKPTQRRPSRKKPPVVTTNTRTGGVTPVVTPGTTVVNPVNNGGGNGAGTTSTTTQPVVNTASGGNVPTGGAQTGVTGTGLTDAQNREIGLTPTPDTSLAGRSKSLQDRLASAKTRRQQIIDSFSQSGSFEEGAGFDDALEDVDKEIADIEKEQQGLIQPLPTRTRTDAELKSLVPVPTVKGGKVRNIQTGFKADPEGKTFNYQGKESYVAYGPDGTPYIMQSSTRPGNAANIDAQIKDLEAQKLAIVPDPANPDIEATQKANIDAQIADLQRQRKEAVEQDRPVVELSKAMQDDREFAYTRRKEQLTESLYKALANNDEDTAAAIRTQLAALEYENTKESKAKGGFKQFMKGVGANALAGLKYGPFGALGAVATSPFTAKQAAKRYDLGKLAEKYTEASTQEQSVLARQKAGQESATRAAELRGKILANEKVYTELLQSKLDSSQTFKLWQTAAPGYEKMKPWIRARIQKETGHDFDFKDDTEYAGNPYALTSVSGIKMGYDAKKNKLYPILNDRNEPVIAKEEVPVDVQITEGGPSFAVSPAKALDVANQRDMENTKVRNDYISKVEDREMQIALKQYDLLVDRFKGYADAIKAFRDKGASTAEEDFISQQLVPLRTELANITQKLSQNDDASTRAQYNKTIGQISDYEKRLAELIGKKFQSREALRTWAAQWGIPITEDGQVTPLAPPTVPNVQLRGRQEFGRIITRVPPKP